MDLTVCGLPEKVYAKALTQPWFPIPEEQSGLNIKNTPKRVVGKLPIAAFETVTCLDLATASGRARPDRSTPCAS